MMRIARLDEGPLWHSTLWAYWKRKVTIKHEINECTGCADSKPGMSGFKTSEVSAASVSLSVCISNWPKSMGYFSETGEYLADLVSGPSIFIDTLGHKLYLFAQ